MRGMSLVNLIFDQLSHPLHQVQASVARSFYFPLLSHRSSFADTKQEKHTHVDTFLIVSRRAHFIFTVTLIGRQIFFEV